MKKEPSSDERSSLAAAGAGDDQQVSAGRRDGCGLVGVELQIEGCGSLELPR